MALMASPSTPSRKFLPRWSLLFMCPITGSTAARRRNSRRMVDAHSALLSGDEDLSALGFGAVAAIAAIDISASDGNAGDPLNLLNLAGQGVAVIGIAGQASACRGRTDRRLQRRWW